MKVFLYRDKNSDDCDCCKYIEDKPLRFECGHYFGAPILKGACFSDFKWAEYDQIETVLTRKEYGQLKKFKEEINNLGYGIKLNDIRYHKGMSLCKEVQPVYDKLTGEENVEFFRKIQKSEIEYLMEEYNLKHYEVKQLFNEYPEDYKDRGIIAYVYESTEELGLEIARAYDYIKREAEPWFDAAAYGEYLTNEDEFFFQLHPSGRCVQFNL